MRNFLKFFINVGKLKRKKRKGWTILYDIKNSESTADHSFRIAILAWLLGKKKGLNLEKVIKMALVHDLCEVFAEDETSYDPLFPKDLNREKIAEIRKRRSRVQYTPEQREERIRRKRDSEEKGLEKLISSLPQEFKNELKSLWLEETKGLSEEGRFVKQLDKMENLIQALEYWKEQGQIERDLWIIAAREWCTDPLLSDFLKEVDEEFKK